MSNPVRRAVYAGSFDPLTLGHVWVVLQGIQLFDELIVAIGENPEKRYTFSLDERLDMLTQSLKGYDSISVKHFTNLYLVDFALEQNAQFILRGIRNSHDFEYEKTIRHINADMASKINTVFVIPPRELSELSSSFVKAMCGPQGWENVVAKMVPKPVFEKLLNQPR